MRLPKFRCKNKVGNWCFFTVLHNGNVDEENFDLETLSEFTGLLDKQGVEIYEGDIVMAPYMNKKPCIVKYSSVLAKFTMSDKFNFTAIDANLEVIGNIYENKELLG